MRVLILGAGAGGGVPQWNCGCRICREAEPRTQAGFAATGNDRDWLLVGASPDLRQQILATPVLAAPAGGRGSPIAAVALLSADIDGIAGLLTLRERHAFLLYAPPAILAILDANRIFDALDRTLVRRIPINAGARTETPAGLMLTLLAMPGKTPLYNEPMAQRQPAPAPTYAAKLEASGRCAIIAPNCAAITPAVRAALEPADLLLFDGTFFTETEMIDAGLGSKTASRMAHIPLSGPAGSLAQLAPLPARKVYVHINNTNPILLSGSPGHAAAKAAGWEIGLDGQSIAL